jgi:hypothetical protein
VQGVYALCVLERVDDYGVRTLLVTQTDALRVNSDSRFFTWRRIYFLPAKYVERFGSQFCQGIYFAWIICSDVDEIGKYLTIEAEFRIPSLTFYA